MRLNPYLSFDGQCEAAFKFYERCLRGKIIMLVKYGDSPLAGQTPPQWHKRVLHATFSWGEHTLQGADALPKTYQKPQGFSVMLNIDSALEAERIFNAQRTARCKFLFRSRSGQHDSACWSINTALLGQSTVESPARSI